MNLFHILIGWLVFLVQVTSQDLVPSFHVRAEFCYYQLGIVQMLQSRVLNFLKKSGEMFESLELLPFRGLLFAVDFHFSVNT